MNRGPDHNLVQSKVLPRRVGAGLFDLALIVGATSITGMAVAERFAVGRRPDGSAVLGPEQQRRLDDLNGPLSRGHEIGDSLFAFSTGAVLMVLAAAALSTIVVGVLVPMLTAGQSPGKILFRLQVVGADGARPSLVNHLARTVIGVADLMPLVVPGLTGFAFAASNSNNQRIGDRVARTVVVERGSRPEPVTGPTAPDEGGLGVHPASISRPPNPTPGPRPEPRPTPTIGAATHPSRRTSRPMSRSTPPPGPSRRQRPVPTTPVTPPGPAMSHANLNSEPQKPDLVTSEADSDAALRIEPTPDSNGPATADPGHPRNGEPKTMSDSANVQQQEASGAADEPTRRRPVEDRAVNPYPKPTRPGRQSDEPPPPSGYTSLALPESSLSDMPLTNSALFEALGLTAEQAAEIMGGPNTANAVAEARQSDSEIPAALQAPSSEIGDTDDTTLMVDNHEGDDQLPEDDGDVSTEVEPTTGGDLEAVDHEIADPQPEPASEPVATAAILIPAAMQPEAETEPEVDVGTEPEQASEAELAPEAGLELEPDSETEQPVEQYEIEEPQDTTELAEPGPDSQPAPAQVITVERPVSVPDPSHDEMATVFESTETVPLEAEPVAVAGPTGPDEATPSAHPHPGMLHAQPTALDSVNHPAASPIEQTSSDTVAAEVVTGMPRLASTAAPDKRAPIWSDDWEAWIYWDTTLRAWFRHDLESGNWVPMEEEEEA